MHGHLRQKLKRQGILSSFNGLYAQKTSRYAKISCKTYLTKILKGHGWITSNVSNVKSLMSSYSTTLKQICTSKGHSDLTDAAKLQLKMDFHYRQAIGELMFAAVTCRPDVFFNNSSQPE